ncbi:MAG TPA: trehalose-phosphatase [Acetobacteraceae bacterium]|nr:trehalose-phosphatase [Acetobacteraceae bacterium]
MTDDPPLPPNAALLLDLDGTLLDIAPTPSAVIVPPGLANALLGLRRRLGDAVAIVTGRSVPQVDGLLPGVPYAVAGEHGAAIRRSPEEPILRAPLPELPSIWLTHAERAIVEHPGALIERKHESFVVHYRLAPDAGPALWDALAAIMGGPESGFALMPAHMAWEVKPRGVDKGRAVDMLMQQPPFAGRVPVYIGDDVTDEDGIREARARGGQGWRVQEAFGAPARVRAWLAKLGAAG